MDDGMKLSIEGLIGMTVAIAVGVFAGLCAFVLWGPDALHLVR